jgi:pyruvate,water dikinase
MARYIRWFGELTLADIPSVGGKNASLGELYRELVPKGIRVPEGFAVTAEAYRRVLGAAELDRRIQRELAGLDTSNLAALAERARHIREYILATPLPEDVRSEIVEACRSLVANGAGDVAVRSSATAEDLPDASFAGQQESFLNVRGERAVLSAYQACLASLFTGRAISYRVDKGFEHDAVALSVGIQRMVRSDVGSAGVIFTLDTETGFRDVVLVSSAWGLGESVVKGRVDPDEFVVHKPTLALGFRPIVKRSIGRKEEKLVYSSRGSATTRAVGVAPAERERASISDDEVLTLARWAVTIEEHYSKRAGKPVPMDIEWARDGRTTELFVLQARPETVHALQKTELSTFAMGSHGKKLLTGRSVGQKIGAGPVRRIERAEDLAGFRQGEVLVAAMTDPDWEPAMKMAAAIVTDRGGRTCHAAIVSRELGVPCVVGTERATSALQNGQLITVSCAEGDVGSIYEGRAEFSETKLDPTSLPRTRTKVKMNVGNPSEAFRLAMLPNDGVGLARMEFIVTSLVRVHPMALVHLDRVPEGPGREEILRLTRGYPDPTEYFVDRLAEGVSRIAAAFYPKDVIVRMSDFKTNEYAHLLGGEPFEPSEENPMLGFRGASRYYHERYREGFLLECRAMRKVREEMGLTNVKLMIPFCRTVEEGKKVVSLMEEAGLARGKDGLEIYVMCEIPANVILAEEFAEVFDGFSIGSNDLTQLTLGVDRDSEIVAPLFDERNPAVYRMVEEAIGKARACKRKIGICGQAPSDYPEFARFVVSRGIDSISLNPDTVIETIRLVAAVEEEVNSVVVENAFSG